MLRRIGLDYQIYGFATVEDPNLVERLRSRITDLSEDQLINSVLLPLLSRMKFERLRRVTFHGPGEFGSDVLPFRSRTPLGTFEYYALQAKAVPIHGTASKSGNAAELISQAVQAFAIALLTISTMSASTLTSSSSRPTRPSPAPRVSTSRAPSKAGAN
jgi:hypothetical protein